MAGSRATGGRALDAVESHVVCFVVALAEVVPVEVFAEGFDVVAQADPFAAVELAELEHVVAKVLSLRLEVAVATA